MCSSDLKLVGASPLDKLHRATRSQPIVLVVATVVREQIDRGAVGGIEPVRHVDGPHRDIAHHADEVNVPVARDRFIGLPDRIPDHVEVAVAPGVRGRFDRRNQARNVIGSTHTTSTVPA